jgi:hypothetical protein
MQLSADGPLQVWHDGEQSGHESPALYDPSGHIVPPFIADGNGLHSVSSF